MLRTAPCTMPATVNAAPRQWVDDVLNAGDEWIDDAVEATLLADWSSSSPARAGSPAPRKIAKKRQAIEAERRPGRKRAEIARKDARSPGGWRWKCHDADTLQSLSDAQLREEAASWQLGATSWRFGSNETCFVHGEHLRLVNKEKAAVGETRRR